MTGKTQIAQALSKKLNVPYYKASTERNAFVKNQDRFIHDIQYSCPARLDLLKQMLEQDLVKGVVYDRGYPCEYAYSDFFARKTDVEALAWLDAQYSKLDATIVLTYRSSYKDIVDDLDPSINCKALERLENSYRTFLSASLCKVLYLCVDDENLEREVIEVMNFLGVK